MSHSVFCGLVGRTAWGLALCPPEGEMGQSVLPQPSRARGLVAVPKPQEGGRELTLSPPPPLGAQVSHDVTLCRGRDRPPLCTPVWPCSWCSTLLAQLTVQPWLRKTTTSKGIRETASRCLELRGRAKGVLTFSVRAS